MLNSTPTFILGIDPGLKTTGWGIIRTEGQALFFVDAGSFSTHSTAPLGERLHLLATNLTALFASHTIDQAAMEETFLNKNPLSSLKLGHARGALITSVMRHDVPFAEYSATHIKKTVVGVGRAEKTQVQHMVKILLPKATWPNEDAADALAVAITHAHSQPIRAYI